MPPRELLDTLPVYLDELAASLEAASTGEPLPATQQVAAPHGQTRLQIGFAPHEVVREYALLRNGILQVAHEQGYAPPSAELIALDSCLFASIGLRSPRMFASTMPCCSGRRTSTSPSSPTSCARRSPRHAPASSCCVASAWATRGSRISPRRSRAISPASPLASTMPSPSCACARPG